MPVTWRKGVVGIGDVAFMGSSTMLVAGAGCNVVVKDVGGGCGGNVVWYKNDLATGMTIPGTDHPGDESDVERE